MLPRYSRKISSTGISQSRDRSLRQIAVERHRGGNDVDGRRPSGATHDGDAQLQWRGHQPDGVCTVRGRRLHRVRNIGGGKTGRASEQRRSRLQDEHRRRFESEHVLRWSEMPRDGGATRWRTERSGQRLRMPSYSAQVFACGCGAPVDPDVNRIAAVCVAGAVGGFTMKPAALPHLAHGIEFRPPAQTVTLQVEGTSPGPARRPRQ